jgi:hypothetical protein
MALVACASALVAVPVVQQSLERARRHSCGGAHAVRGARAASRRWDGLA